MALKDVSFQVEDGEFLAVIGLSGSGKSTLLRCINRLIEPTSGKVIWNDIDITAAPQSELRNIRRQIGMVFQQFNLVKRSSVLTNVLSGRLGYVNPYQSLFNYFSPADQQRAMDNLEHIGLTDKAHVRADSLSGGQQQRVGIARALMQEPKLILADEPVASLDPVLAHSILKYLEQMNKERKHHGAVQPALPGPGAPLRHARHRAEGWAAGLPGAAEGDRRRAVQGDLRPGSRARDDHLSMAILR